MKINNFIKQNKQCLRCNITLTLKNIRKYNIKEGYYVCNNCYRKEALDYFHLNNPNSKHLVNPPNCKIKRCTKCLTVLNNFNRCKEHNYTVCQECFNKIFKQKNREKERKWFRSNITTTVRDGKQIWIKGNKRPYPLDQKCELCNQVKTLLIYHHWEDKNMLKGLWLCSGINCHGLAEALDKYGIEIAYKYLELKEKINNLSIVL